MRGIKLNGARDGYHINDKKLAYPVIEKLAENGLIFATHCGSNSPIHSHPFLIREISKDFPKLKIIMVHMGGSGVPSEGLYDAAIQVSC